MRKPRMTRSEKAFSEWATKIVFDGQRYSTKEGWAKLNDENRERFIKLLLTKTR